jgi:toxin secretion/phage lysis holin
MRLGHNTTSNALHTGGRFHLKTEVFKMLKTIWAYAQSGFAGLGALLGWYLGGLDGLLYALIAFVAVDYITGLLRAVVEKNLSSRIGAKGIAKKVAIFLVVGIGHLIDTYLLGGAGSPLRSAVICFYIANEGVSLLENATAIGLPVPEQLKNVLAQLHGKAEDNTGGNPSEDDRDLIVAPHPEAGTATENKEDDNEPA